MKVKITLLSAEEPEIRRMTLENHPDFAEFERKVSELFGKTTGTFTFHWKDDEGDIITMSSDEEFQEAMKSATEETLRINLRRIEDHSKLEEGMKFDYNPSDEKDKMIPEELGPRRWERRRRHWRGLGQGHCPLPFRRFRQTEQQLRNDQPLSEKKMRRCMRRKIEGRERFDRPGSSIDQYRAGCGRHREKGSQFQEGDQNPMSSEACREKPGTWCHWNGNNWRRRCNLRSARHFRKRLDEAYMAHVSCRSRRRNREIFKEFCQGRKCCRRANSAPPTRLYERNLYESEMIMRGKGKRCRRSTSVPVCSREIGDETLASSRCRRRRYRNGKLWLKFKVNRFPNPFTDSASGEEKGHLRRRCKSYRRRAAMLANEESRNANRSATQEPEISELVETMTIEDGEENTKESEARASISNNCERKRKCRHRRHCDKDGGRDENKQSGETNKRKYHCKRRCGHKRHLTESHETFEKNQENAEQEDPVEAKRQRKCRIKASHRCREMERDDATRCRNSRTKEHGKGVLTLKVRVNDDMKMRPQKLARKLYRILNQYSTDCQENEPRGRRYRQESLGIPRDHDFERQLRRMLRRQGCRRERARFLSPEFPSNVGKDFASSGPRRIRPRDCPW
ncbi:uncharacterized protein LOC133171658 [Saccostrea echinata]|uniref:uncharacterized protein LOC133171658 n=1 Tax=Saccostrea echinata TaxID=191078 RepID=UPI002A7FE8CD|nr:uncharacterized protein LOC133171658 [Saccostrea echinata]